MTYFNLVSWYILFIRQGLRLYFFTTPLFLVIWKIWIGGRENNAVSSKLFYIWKGNNFLISKIYNTSIFGPAVAEIMLQKNRAVKCEARQGEAWGGEVQDARGDALRSQSRLDQVCGPKRNHARGAQ